MTDLDIIRIADACGIVNKHKPPALMGTTGLAEVLAFGAEVARRQALAAAELVEDAESWDTLDELAALIHLLAPRP